MEQDKPTNRKTILVTSHEPIKKEIDVALAAIEEEGRERGYLIVGAGDNGLTALALEKLEKEHGPLTVISPDDAEKYLKAMPKEVRRPTEPFALEPVKLLNYGNEQSGQESRRARRAAERKYKK